MSLVEFELPDWLTGVSAREIEQKILNNIELDVDKTKQTFICGQKAFGLTITPKIAAW